MSSLVNILEKLQRNARLGKHKHFAAADRAWRRHMLFGVFGVLLNVVLGSLFVEHLSILPPDDMKYGGPALALAAAAFSGLQTFFNFSKAFEAHRQIGNKYLYIARKCGYYAAKYKDGLLGIEEVSRIVEGLIHDYSKVCVDAEAFPTNKRDHEKAKDIQRRKEKEKEREKRREDEYFSRKRQQRRDRAA